MASIFAKFLEEMFGSVATEAGPPSVKENYTVIFHEEEDIISSKYEANQFHMYGIVFRDLGIWLPFSDFQVNVIDHLCLAPS